jgi:Rod binding domain-containing protein
LTNDARRDPFSCFVRQGHAFGRGDETRHLALVKQTQKWVAQSFYGTMLKQMRKSPFHSEMFDGGRGGQMFHALMDQQLAGHMSQRTAPGLVNAIVQKIEGGRATASYKQQSDWSDIANQARTHVSALG